MSRLHTQLMLLAAALAGGCVAPSVADPDGGVHDGRVAADAGADARIATDAWTADALRTDRGRLDAAVADGARPDAAPHDGAGRDLATARDGGPLHRRGSLAACLLDPQCQRVAITAHQGAWNASIPGNSMAAYQRAYDLGADGIEADVRVSQDGVIFMIHDDEITYYESLECLGKVISRSPASEIETCTLLPASANQTIPTFDQFVEWARGKIWIHLDVKNTADLPLVVSETIAHQATDYVFIAVSGGEVATVMPGIAGSAQVWQVLRVESVAAVDLALGDLRRPNIFMLEGDRTWNGVDETAMQAQVARVHGAGLRIMASTESLPIQATAANHQRLFDMGFDDVLSYNTDDGVPVANAVNSARGY